MWSVPTFIAIGLSVCLIVAVSFLIACKMDKKSSAPAPAARAKKAARGRESLVATPASKQPQVSSVAAEQLRTRQQMAASLNTAALSAESRRRKI